MESALASPVTSVQSYGGNMTVLDMLDRAFRIYRQNFVPFLAITAAVSVPVAILSIPVTIAQQRDPLSDTTTALQLFSAIFNLVAIVVQIVVVQSIITYMASELFLGSKSTLGAAFRNVRSRFLPITGGIILVLIIIAVGYLFSALLIACYVGIVGLIIMGYLSAGIGYFLIPVLTLEDVNSIDGINRAWHLGKRRFWRGFSLMTLTFLITLVFYLSLGIVAELAYNPLISAGYEDFVTGLRIVVNNVITVAATPLQFIALTVFYYDTRVRLESMNVSFYLSKHTNPRPIDVPSPKPSGGVLNGQDALNILMLVGGVTAIIIVIFAIGYVTALTAGLV